MATTFKPIAPVDTADPWIISHNNTFYFTFTIGDRVSIWSSPLLHDFYNARKSIIWKPQPGTPWSEHIWAPELHLLNGVWYIYATATMPGKGNPGHRTIVLKSTHPDPMHIPGWQFLGPIRGLPEIFSIDATVFSPQGKELYLCWSGWPPDSTPDTQQNLYIKQLISPEEAVPESVMPSICISRADQPWERFENDRRGINEGPQWLSLPDGSFHGIVYSGHASFTSEYKLGLLRLVSLDADPLDPRSWKKRPAPLLMNDKSKPGPYAPGHASFLPSPHPGDGKVMCIYHATANWGEGFKNRKARIMMMGSEPFRDDAAPCCCSETWYGGPPLAGAGQVGGRPDESSQHGHQPQDQSAHGHGDVPGEGQGNAHGGPSGFRKQVDEAVGNAPAPVQKAYDKFKKYF